MLLHLVTIGESFQWLMLRELTFRIHKRALIIHLTCVSHIMQPLKQYANSDVHICPSLQLIWFPSTGLSYICPSSIYKQAITSNTEIREVIASYPLDANLLNVIMKPIRPDLAVWNHFVNCDVSLHRIYRRTPLMKAKHGIDLYTSS